MAAKKKTIVQEFKELIDSTPKANILTKADLELLREIAENIADVRHILSRLSGEENISSIMFEVGSSFKIIDDCEDKLDVLLDSFDKCDECGDDY